MIARREITNTEDVIDSRDIIERIKYLEDTEDEDEQAELKALEALAEEAGQYSEWAYGLVLIRESYWIEYVQELLEDIGDLPKDFPWYIVIDWEETANNIKADYTTVDFDGVEYLYRMS